MLTTRQVLMASGQNIGNTLITSALLTEFPARPLSLKSVITAYEKQRRLVFVSLISPRILLSRNIHSKAELLQASKGIDGQMHRHEILALSSKLQEHDLLLKLVDKDMRRAAIVGTVSSLVNIPAIPVNDSNLLQVRDQYSAGEAIGGITATIGAVLIALAVVPEPASPVLLGLGAVLTGGGAGFGIGAGIMDIWNTPPPPPKSNSPQSTTTPNEVDPSGEDDGIIELPNAVALGTPPDGLDTNSTLQQLGDFALDLVLSGIPIGWDSDNGVALPVIGDDGDGDGGDGDGIPIPFG